MRYGMVIDLQKCVGCAGCIFACKAENNTEIGKNWCDKIIHSSGKYPNIQFEYISTMCNHCADAPCVKKCPENALYKDEYGLTMLDSEKCIGCEACISFCPYNVIHFNYEETGKFWQSEASILPSGVYSPKTMLDATGSAVSPFGNPEIEATTRLKRPKNTVEKCTFCAHRLQAGKQPACVDACPSGARIVGDLDDPNSTVRKLIEEHDAKPLNPDLHIGEKVFYIRDYTPSTQLNGEAEKDVIVFNASKCIGCSKCEAECRIANDVPKEISYLDVKKQEINGEDYFFRYSCQHCEHAKCLDNCPTGAIERRTGGQVTIDEEKCIGCQTCAMTCPYDIPQYNEKTAKVGKCTGCYHLVEAGLQPACVESCPQKALLFGAKDDLKDQLSAMTNNEQLHAYGLEKVNDYVGELGLVTIAKQETMGTHLLDEDPSNLSSSLRSVAKTGAVVGVAGAVAVSAAHRAYLSGKTSSADELNQEEPSNEK